MDITPNKTWNDLLEILARREVSELEANGPGSFFIKRNGRREKVEVASIKTADDYYKSIEEGLATLVSTDTPFSEARYLFEGEMSYNTEDLFVKGRCHIVMPPTSRYPMVTIAKRSGTLLRLSDIATNGSMSQEMYDFLVAALRARLTIVISGSTGAGKTTMLEAMTKEVPNDIRYGVAEDSPELTLPQENVAYLNSTPWRPGMDDKNVAPLSWVVSQFQRMRTDRIIVGETRGREFSDFLVAANSGMEGSMTTIHADDPRSCLRKMTTFTSEARPGAPMRLINTDIASGIDLIVQLVILPNGEYRVTHIEEISNTIGQGDDAVISTTNLYSYNVGSNSFVKQANISDKMRERFTKAGVSFERFTSSPVGFQTGHMVGEQKLRSNVANRNIGSIFDDEEPVGRQPEPSEDAPTRGIPRGLFGRSR